MKKDPNINIINKTNNPEIMIKESSIKRDSNNSNTLKGNNHSLNYNLSLDIPEKSKKLENLLNTPEDFSKYSRKSLITSKSPMRLTVNSASSNVILFIILRYYLYILKFKKIIDLADYYDKNCIFCR